MSVPTTVNVVELSSALRLVILALLPVVSTKAAFVPTFTELAPPSVSIFVTVLKIFVDVTVPLAVGPVMVSEIAFPSISVPTIENETPDKSLVLLIVRKEFNPLEAAPDCAPSIVKSFASVIVSLSTRPSVSVVVTDPQFNVSAVPEVPDCELPILSVSAEPLIFKKLSKFDPILLIEIDEEDPFEVDVML